MDNEQKKVHHFISELIQLWSMNPNLINNRQCFEIWEETCQPRPFSGKSITLLDNKLNLPANNHYIVYLSWNSERNQTELVAETNKTQYTFDIHISKKGVSFSQFKTTPFYRHEDNPGKKMEIIYDVINHIVNHEPGMNVFKLKKKEFVQQLQLIGNFHDKNLLNQMAKLPNLEIKNLIQQAASDMALDDLSSQLSLPMGSTYAFDASSQLDKRSKKEAHHIIIPLKTHWRIIQEMEMLRAMTKHNYDVQKAFVLPLKACEILGSNNRDITFIKIPHVKDLLVEEGKKLTIHQRGKKSPLGTFIISLFDYDTIYGELHWNDFELTENFNHIYLLPQQSAHKLQMQFINELFNQIKHQPDRIKGSLRYILGLEETPYASQYTTKSSQDMDFSQKNALDACIHKKNPIVTIQGPPGTGKTWVLAKVIQSLCSKGQRILVTAPSHAAVDNICKRILDLPVLRFGNPDKINPLIIQSCWFGKEDNVKQFIKKLHPKKPGKIFAATHLRAVIDDVITSDIDKNGLFDVIIFDESGMTRMDDFLLCAQLGKRIILFGDHQQLPPFPLSTEVIKRLNDEHQYISWEIKQIIYLSALEWLTRIRKIPLIMLERTYRCQNPRLMRFSSTLFYHAKVITSEKAEYFRLPYHERQKKYPASTLCFYSTSMLPKAVRTESVVWDSAKIGIENQCEAELCQKIVLNAIKKYQSHQITVISPYRRQVALIRKVLDYQSIQNHLPPGFTKEQWDIFLHAQIATVDSFQGGESDIVIISYVRSNSNQGIGFVDNPNRINVAHTRCRREIVIIGDLECLKKQAKSDIFIRMERAFLRDGKIIQVTNDFCCDL